MHEIKYENGKWNIYEDGVLLVSADTEAQAIKLARGKRGDIKLLYPPVVNFDEKEFDERGEDYKYWD